MSKMIIGKAELFPEMYVKNPQGYLSYQAFAEVEKEFSELKERLQNADDTIKEIFSMAEKSWSYESAYYKTYHICEDYLDSRNRQLSDTNDDKTIK